MSNNKNIKSPVDLAQERPMRVQDVPGKTAAHHAENRMEDGGSNKGSQHRVRLLQSGFSETVWQCLV
mgnify:CR=1 FL=1